MSPRPGRAGLRAAGMAVTALALSGCAEEGDRPLASATLLGLEADQVLVGVEMNLTRAGVRNAVLVADTAFSFQEEGLLQLRNLVITFYGDTGLEEGVLTGRQGEYDFETGNVEVNGQVEVNEALGSKRLVTERLRYVAAVDSLYGDTTFVLYRPGLESRGNSFVSDAQLENVQILNPSFVSDGDAVPAGRTGPE